MNISKKRFLSLLIAGIVLVSSVLGSAVGTLAGEHTDDAERDVTKLVGYMEMQAVEATPEEIAQVNANYKSNMKFAQNHDSDTWQKYSTYYFYNQLSDAEKAWWDEMYTNCLTIINGSGALASYLTPYVDIESDMDLDDWSYLTSLFRVSNPQFYFLRNGFSYSTGWGASCAFMVYKDFSYGSRRTTATNQFKTQIESWVSTIQNQSGEFAKVQKAHDIVVLNVDYNHGVLEDSNISETEEEDYYTQSAYSMVCTNLTVCAGYSQAFALLCNAAGVDALSVTSSDHQWNKVRVGDSWYNLDTTWDDSGGSSYNYDYFLKNQTYFRNNTTSHNEESLWYSTMPACTRNSTADGNSAGSIPPAVGQTGNPSFTVTPSGSQYRISISCNTSGAKIYYTTDGATLPSSAYTKSKLYTGTFTVSNSDNVRAIAVCDKYSDSSVVSATGCAHLHTTVRDRRDATCTTNGYSGDTYCTDCGQKIAVGYVIPGGHKYDGPEIKATTTSDGSKGGVCQSCGIGDKQFIYRAATVKCATATYTYTGGVKTPSVIVKTSAGENLIKDEDYSLSYASGRTNIGKYEITVTFQGDYTGSKTISFSIVPPAPGYISATPGSNSIKASWSKVSGVSGYKVSLYQDGEFVNSEVVSSSTTSYTFSKLVSDTNYTVKVRAYKTVDGRNYWSGIQTVETATVLAAPSITYLKPGSKSAAIRWNSIDIAEGYQVYYATSSNGSYKKASTPTGTGTTVKGLKKGKTYYFKVRAYRYTESGTEYSSYSSVKSVKVK